MNSRISDLYEKAELFRRSLEEYRSRTDYIGLVDFPTGSCADASILLGQYLSDSGLGQWNFSSGERENVDCSHAWIQLDGVLIDITASQFEEISAAVWITTTDSAWHSRFLQIDPPTVAVLDGWDEYTQENLRAIYADLRAGLA